jgi:hypothetical protein
MILFEVMDKAPPLGEILVPIVIAGIASFLLCLWKPMAWIVALPCCALIGLFMTSEILGEFVGPAIRAEDPVYWYASILTALACCMAPLLGSIMSPRRTNRLRGNASGSRIETQSFGNKKTE